MKNIEDVKVLKDTKNVEDIKELKDGKNWEIERFIQVEIKGKR